MRQSRGQPRDRCYSDIADSLRGRVRASTPHEVLGSRSLSLSPAPLNLRIFVSPALAAGRFSLPVGHPSVAFSIRKGTLSVR